jgi:hypothetical protein
MSNHRHPKMLEKASKRLHVDWLPFEKEAGLSFLFGQPISKFIEGVGGSEKPLASACRDNGANATCRLVAHQARITEKCCGYSIVL